MSLFQHVLDELLELTQQEINTIHLEIHKITNRDIEGIESEEMSKEERKEYEQQKKEISESEPYILKKKVK